MYVFVGRRSINAGTKNGNPIQFNSMILSDDKCIKGKKRKKRKKE
jgi:hypothetical protein